MFRKHVDPRCYFNAAIFPFHHPFLTLISQTMKDGESLVVWDKLWAVFERFGVGSKWFFRVSVGFHVVADGFGWFPRRYEWFQVVLCGFEWFQLVCCFTSHLITIPHWLLSFCIKNSRGLNCCTLAHFSHVFPRSDHPEFLKFLQGSKEGFCGGVTHLKSLQAEGL